nr:reverse transcriptase domain-containing protein [Tanacetum cinerariifolium]
MSTRSSARNLFPPLDNPVLTIRRRSRADPTLLNEFEMAAEGNGDPPVPDLWTIKELCQPSLNGRGEPIAPIAIQATNFVLKNDMIQQSIKVNGVTDDALRLYLFPHSLTHHVTAWFDHLLKNYINTFEQMAKMFLGKYFPPFMVTKLINEFRQQIVALKAEMTKINKNLMRVLQVNQQVKSVTPNCETCSGPHSYNDCSATIGQTQNVYAAGAYQGGNSYQPQGNNHHQGNNQGRNQFFQRASHGQNPHPDYQAPGYQALVHQPPIPQPQVVTTNEFTNYMKANDAILKNMQTNMTSLINSNLELKNMFGQFMEMNTASTSGSRTLPSNTITNPKEDLKGITTRSGNAYQGPMIPTTFSSLPKVVERETEDLYFNISFANALILMPKFGSTIKTLLTNKDKLYELARTPRNEHCSVVLLKKLPEKLGDPGKFLIPCDFLGMDECLAMANLGASINLMPMLVWNKLALPELSPTCMTLKLADSSISRPVGVPKDVFLKVGTFHFPTDFVFVDFDADPRVPLILERSFLKTERALIDVFKGKLTLRVSKEAITFNLDQTLRYSANYNDMTTNRID